MFLAQHDIRRAEQLRDDQQSVVRGRLSKVPRPVEDSRLGEDRLRVLLRKPPAPPRNEVDDIDGRAAESRESPSTI
jgi:hypothetical protein